MYQTTQTSTECDSPNEAGAETPSVNNQAGWRLFSQLKQDIQKLREENMDEQERECAGRDTQAS